MHSRLRQQAIFFARVVVHRTDVASKKDGPAMLNPTPELIGGRFNDSILSADAIVTRKGFPER